MSHERLLVTSSRYLPNIGGIENSMLHLSNALMSLGYEVDIVSSDIFEGERKELARHERSESGVNVYRHSYYILGKSSALWSYITGLCLYRKLKNNHSYKAVICRNHVTVILCWLAGFRKIVYVLPGLVKVQNNPDNSGFGKRALKYYQRILAYYYHQLLQWIAVRLTYKNFVFSDVAERQLRRDVNYKGPVFKTRPGVDPRVFTIPTPAVKSAFRKENGFTSKDIVLLGLGRFVDAKKFDYLIEALPHLPAEYRVLLVGSGSLRCNYEEIIERLNISHRVTIIKGSNDISCYYMLSDIFVLSSTYESFGQTLLEAQASGLPVVAFSCAHPSTETATNEAVEQYTSVMVDDISPCALAKGIIEAAHNLQSNIFRPEEIREFSVSVFSWKNMAKDIMALC